jgi:hypothetical protein
VKSRFPFSLSKPRLNSSNLDVESTLLQSIDDTESSSLSFLLGSIYLPPDILLNASTTLLAGRSVSVVEEEESTDYQLHHSSGPLAFAWRSQPLMGNSDITLHTAVEPCFRPPGIAE